jgi:hypothetical protein
VLAALVSCLLAAGEAAPSRSLPEVAAESLAIHFKAEAARGLARSVEGRSFPESMVDDVLRHMEHVDAVAFQVAASGRADQRDAANFGVNLAGLWLDFLVIDMAGAVHQVRGITRVTCNDGIRRLWKGMEFFKEDPLWSIRHQEEARAMLAVAEGQRDRVLLAARLGNDVLKPGVAAASIMSSALSLAVLAKSAPAALARLLGWMRGGGFGSAGLAVATVGGRIQIQAVAGSATLVLTPAEVAALAATGQVAAKTYALYLLARGALHHICTDKNWISESGGGPWSPVFERFLQGAGMGFDDPANLVEVEGHIGPHPEAYHRRIELELRQATEDLVPGTTAYRDAVQKALKRLGEECARPGSLLNKLLTGALRE